MYRYKFIFYIGHITTILMDILTGSFSSYQRQTFTLGSTMISDMWSGNFKNLHACVNLIVVLVVFINTNYDK